MKCKLIKQIFVGLITTPKLLILNLKYIVTLFNSNRELTIIQRESIIQKKFLLEIIPCHIWKQKGYKKDSGFYDKKTKTIYLTDNYSHHRMRESVFIHELIHFFDFNGFKNVNEFEIKLVNEKIKYIVDFQVNVEIFTLVFNKVIKYNFHFSKKFSELLRKNGYSRDSIFLNQINEYRAYEGQSLYNSMTGIKY